MGTGGGRGSHSPSLRVGGGDPWSSWDLPRIKAGAATRPCPPLPEPDRARGGPRGALISPRPREEVPLKGLPPGRLGRSRRHPQPLCWAVAGAKCPPLPATCHREARLRHPSGPDPAPGAARWEGKGTGAGFQELRGCVQPCPVPAPLRAAAAAPGLCPAPRSQLPPPFNSCSDQRPGPGRLPCRRPTQFEPLHPIV